MNTGTGHGAGRTAGILAALLGLFIVAVLWAKTGKVAAASGGDEVWMGEGAYWLLKEGVHRYHFLADEHGHQIVSTFQPISAAFTAVLFALFGLGPFTLMAQVPVVGTAAMVLLALIGRRLELPGWLCLLLPAAAWGLMTVERRLNIVRWEPMVAMWMLLAFWLLLEARGRKGAGAGWLRALAGVSVTLAGVTYYPLAPFCLLAGTGAAVLTAGVTPWREVPRRNAAFVAGGVVSGGLFLAWIFKNYEYFYRQVVAFGGEHYLSVANLLWPFVNLWRPGSMVDWVCILEHAGLAGLAGWIWFRRPDGPWRAAAWATLWMLAPIFLFRRPVMDVTGGLFGVLVLAGFVAPGRRWAAAALWLLALAGAGKFLLHGYTMVAQGEKRSYPLFQEKLLAVVGDGPGAVASSQFTWLALRERKGPKEYHFIAKYGDPSYAYRSTELRSAEGIRSLRYLILGDGFDDLIRIHYPEMQAAIDDGTFVQKARIEMPRQETPWSKAAIFECTVLENTGWKPDSVNGD